MTLFLAGKWTELRGACFSGLRARPVLTVFITCPGWLSDAAWTPASGSSEATCNEPGGHASAAVALVPGKARGCRECRVIPEPVGTP